MARKVSVQLIILTFVAAIVLVASGCAKKQMVKEETAGKGMVTKKEEAMPPAPQIMEKPKAEASNPAMAPAVKPEEETLPKEAAKIVEKPFDLAVSRIQFAFDDYSLSGQSERRLNRVAE